MDWGKKEYNYRYCNIHISQAELLYKLKKHKSQLFNLFIKHIVHLHFICYITVKTNQFLDQLDS